jgi:hypothetical protein
MGSPSMRGAGELLAFGDRDLFGCNSLKNTNYESQKRKKDVNLS